MSWEATIHRTWAACAEPDPLASYPKNTSKSGVIRVERIKLVSRLGSPTRSCRVGVDKPEAASRSRARRSKAEPTSVLSEVPTLISLGRRLHERDARVDDHIDECFSADLFRRAGQGQRPVVAPPRG